MFRKKPRVIDEEKNLRWWIKNMKGNYKHGTFTYLFIGLCVVFSSVMALTPIASAAQHYVNPGESIQVVVNNASDGDMIIVRDGSYTENIDVNKRLTIQSENGSAATTVQAANTSDHVLEVSADYVTISGFTIEGALEGIHVSDVNNCNLSNNVVSCNYQGIVLSKSSWNIIFNNAVFSNNNSGIVLADGSSCNQIIKNNASNNVNYHGIAILNTSKNNEIRNNIACYNHQVGIGLLTSSENTIANNTAKNNGYHGIFLENSNHNRIIDNKASNNNGYHGIALKSSNNNEIRNNIAHDNHHHGVRLQASSENIIANNTATNNSINGIYIKESSNNRITDNDASNNVNYQGILLWTSSENIIANNTAKNNGRDGIYLREANNNSITDNDASSNVNYRGISLWASNNNEICNNIADYNYQGIILGTSSENIIANNTAKNNRYMGIYLKDSNNSRITDNDASYNVNYSGIYLESSSNNEIRNNNAIFNNHAGICIFSSNYNIISNNNLCSNSWGLGLAISRFNGNTSNNQIRDNNLNFNKYDGMILWDLRHFNNITNNNASINNLFGIRVLNSTSQAISNNTANLNERGIGLDEASEIKLINNAANANEISGFSLIKSTNNTLLDNSASFNTYEGIYLSNSSLNFISNNNVSSNYFGISLYSSNGNNIINNIAESSYYFEVFLHSSDENNIINNTWYSQEDIVRGVRLYVLEAVTPSLQIVENRTNATYNIIAENLGNSPDTFDLVLSSTDNPEISSLDTDSVFLGAGEISINTTTTTTEINLTDEKTPLDEKISTNTTTAEVEPPQVTTIKMTIPSVKTITLNVGDTKPGIYTVKVEIISRHDNTVKDAILTRTIVPGQVDSVLINSQKTKSAIINSSINNSIIDTSAIINSSISDSVITGSIINNTEVVSTSLNDVIVEDAVVFSGNILSGSITLNKIKYEISNETRISELVIGKDYRNSNLVGITNKTLVINTRNSNTSFNISAEKDYFAASMCVQKSSIPPEGIPEFTNNIGGYVFANASANLVNSTGWLILNVFYDQTELGALDESTLRLRYFNESAGSWEDLPVSGINLTGNYVWSNISHYSVFALLAQPAPSDDAYDSSDSSGDVRPRPEEVNIPIANPGMNIFNFEWLGLDILEISTDLERMAINARVALKKILKPVELPNPQGIVYGYFEISTTLKSENVKSAGIYFRVSKSWIDDNEIATINMCRYASGWEELKTEKVKEDNNYFYYIAETPGLSIFVIIGEKKAEDFTPPAMTPTPTVQPTTSPVPSVIPTATSAPPSMIPWIGLRIIAVIVASAMIVLVAYLLLRGRKKKLS